MTLKQLRFLREIARQSLNMSSAALALHTSQPGVSRQLKELERELGVEFLVRRKNRVLALTDAGQAVLVSARRMLDRGRQYPADRRRLAGTSAAGGWHRTAICTRGSTLLAPVVPSRNDIRKCNCICCSPTRTTCRN